jgi:MFS family permease
MADRVPSRNLIVVGLLLYPFVGLSYFLAGIGGLAFFIVIARLLNGAAYALDSVGRETYIRMHVPSGSVSEAFGYFETLTNIWWIVALFAGMVLIRFVKVYQLFLAIVPTSLIALWLVYRVDHRDHHEHLGSGFQKVIHGGILEGMWAEIGTWGYGHRLLAGVTFLLGALETLGELFIPIYAYTRGVGLVKVIAITAAFALPGVFGRWLGSIADRERGTAIIWGLGLIAGLLTILSAAPTYSSQLVSALGIGFVLELVALTRDGVLTRLTKAEHYGRVSSAFESVSELGSLAGPMLFGLLIDRIGAPSSFLTIAVITLGVGAFLFTKRQSLTVPVRGF